MKIELIEYPSAISLDKYSALKAKMVKELLAHNSILSVYQMGSVKDPGISDLDLICVFQNDSENRNDYRSNLSQDEKLILTHGLFGVEKKDLEEALPYNLMSNLQLLGGEDMNLNKVESLNNTGLNQQIAIEYLVKMFITLDTQKTLKIVKLRSFLLLAKAISFDLKLLNISEGKLYDLVERVLKFRSIWFTNQPNKKEITNLILEFHTETKLLLERLFIDEKFYLPVNEINLPGNFNIQKADVFGSSHKGFVLPSQFKFLGKKYINLQYRLNQFQYSMPFDIPKNDSILKNRFEFTQYLVDKNRMQYPAFFPIMSSLSLY
ncbi:hypothetical protein [Psychroserpens ponticola]|uniref:Polymerase nucleotidyl transferase domain-containing protein n=1 Tax=Psychroserpens ponticola TaxID=2932268 RepID=A0ABY7RVK1_9FLAO|nr:hypothetical protein [Psychroserpens ponticola]WCO01134.1 hypothetical protein MUN68_013805 [Psychroserpens ponticola]